MKTKINFLLTVIALVFALQSCLTKPKPILEQFDDKLLLSKVTGTIQSQDPNFFAPIMNLFYTYKWTNDVFAGGANTGSFERTYSYESIKRGTDDFKRIQEETFLNAGHYDFIYQNLTPDKVNDNSLPGRDLGLWKFYLNQFAQVEKVGLAFSSTTDPVRFEFYTHNYKDELTSFIYGNAPDTPRFKVVYQYDYSGNITQFDLYTPVASAAATSQDLVLNDYGQKTENLLTAKSNNTLNKKLAKQQFSLSNTEGKQNNLTSSGDAPDASIQYKLYMTAKVTTDWHKNPLSQQRNILFYQTNRSDLYDPTPYFQSLLKSNPVRIEYSVPEFGPDLAVQTFSYSYNSKGYPVTIHEDFSDPDFAFIGNYTQDSQIEYITNH